MTKTHFIVLILIFTAVEAGTHWVMHNVVPQRWEYRTAYIDVGEDGYFLGEDLKTLGKSGWEMVTVIPRNDKQHICYLKRPALK